MTDPAATATLHAALLDACSDAVISVTAEGLIGAWNPAAERLFGYGAAEVIGQPLAGLLPGLDISEPARAQPATAMCSGERRRPVSVRVVAGPGMAGAMLVLHADPPPDPAIGLVYRRVIESLPDCLNVKDKAGRFLIANAATADLMQARSAEDLIGKTDFDFYPTAVAEAFLRDEQAILADGMPRLIEQEATLKDGKHVHLSTLKVPFRDQAGMVTGLITLNRDITGEKHLRRQFAESQDHLADALAYMPDGLAMFDASGTLLFCNQQYRSLIGEEEGALRPGRSLLAILSDVAARGGFRVAPRGLEGPVELSAADLLRSLEDAEFQLADGRWIESRAKFTAHGDCLLLSIDVTARRKAAAALEESERRYRQVAEITQEAWWEEDLQTSQLTNSQRFCEILGMGSEILHCSLAGYRELIHPEDRPRTRAAHDRSIRLGLDYRETYRLRHADGHYVWVEDHGRVIARDSHGTSLRMLGAITDITARRQAELALRESEERYREVAEITQEAWWEEHLPTRRVKHSLRFCQMLGLGDDMLECSLERFVDLIHPEDRDLVQTSFYRALSDGVDYKVSYRLRHADGHYVWVEDRGRVIERDAANAPVRVLGALTDITARLAAEAALQESEQNFRTLFDGAPDANIIVDAADMRILTCNRAAETMLRGSRERILALTPMDISPPLQPDGVTSPQAAVEKARQILDKGHLRFAWMIRRLDGTDVPVDVLATVGTYRQRQALYVSWREMGEIIAAKQAAEAASIAKSQFLSVMSHELRTPLNAIMGMFQLIEMAGVGGKVREFVARGMSSSEHLLKLVEEILDFSSIEAGRLVVARAPFRLGSLIEEVGDVGVGKCRDGVELAVEAADELRNLELSGDALRLKQVLINLLGNALKFTDTGRVALSVAKVGGGPEAPLLEFAVVDTGIGLTPEQKGRLFQPFTQVDMSNVRRFGGTGLGLVISQRLVGLMGGEPIAVESQAGKGSRFSFRLALPVAATAATASVARPAAASPLPAGRLAGLGVLLVEDSETVRFALRLLLQSEGARVEEAADGAQGVSKALAAAPPFDAVLMDMQMPVQDGLAAARELRARGYASPILALTANAFARDREACFAAGMTDYIAKPVKKEGLVEALLRNCRRPA